MMVLWGLRIFLLLLILFVVVYTVSSEMDSWCSHSDFDSHGGSSRNMWDTIKDQNYTIEESKRQPQLSMKEFYQVEDRGLTDMMMRTRLTFKRQNHIGTVMRDGFHADLPEGTMWMNGKLVMGEDVRQQMELSKQPMPMLPHPTPSVGH